MKKSVQQFSFVFLMIGALILVACGEEENTRAWENPDRPSCTKATAGQSNSPLYKQSTGGEIREQLSNGTRVTVLRAKGGRSLVRVRGTKNSGWLDGKNIGSCVTKRTKSSNPQTKTKQ